MKSPSVPPEFHEGWGRQGEPIKKSGIGRREHQFRGRIVRVIIAIS